MIPTSWQKHPVGKLCQSIVPGRNKPKIFDGDIPWVTTPDISGRYIPSSLQKKFISKEAIKDAGARLVPEGAVIMAAVGDLGLVAIARQDVVLNQQLHAFVCSEKIHNEFLAYWLETQTPYMESVASKTTISYMNKANCESIPVLVPPLLEQKKISKILSTWDKAVETTASLLFHSQKQKKALMQILLTGKKRLAGFSGQWTEVTLNSVADMSSGGTPNSSIDDYYGGGVSWVSIADMTRQGKWINFTEKTLSNTGLENSSAKIYPKNTILYAMYASIGECSIAAIPLCSSQAILGIRPRKELHYEYLYFYLASLKEKIKLQGQQGTQANLNAGMVKAFTILLPCVEEQKAISSLLNLADREIDTLQQKINHLKQEKKALMQQLLTGKRRVKTEVA